jgi:hypothetical protein
MQFYVLIRRYEKLILQYKVFDAEKIVVRQLKNTTIYVITFILKECKGKNFNFYKISVLFDYHLLKHFSNFLVE